jgi:hypothetical protein
MQGVLSCLLAAGAVSLAFLTPDPAAASDGFGRHAPVQRPHFRPHRPIVRQGGFHNHFDGHRFSHHGFDHRRFDRHGFKHHGFKHNGFANGFFPSSYLVGSQYPSSVTIIQQGEPSTTLTTGTIPSVADLPAVTGIVSQPAAEPTVYVVNGARREAPALSRRGERSGGAKILTVDPSDAPNVAAEVSTSGPRIIHLDVPVGR